MNPKSLVKGELYVYNTAYCMYLGLEQNPYWPGVLHSFLCGEKKIRLLPLEVSVKIGPLDDIKELDASDYDAGCFILKAGDLFKFDRTWFHFPTEIGMFLGTTKNNNIYRCYFLFGNDICYVHPPSLICICPAY